MMMMMMMVMMMMMMMMVMVMVMLIIYIRYYNLYVCVCVCVCLWGEEVMFRRKEVYWSFMSFRGHWIIPTDEFWDVGNCWVSPVHREPRGHYCKSYPTTASLKSNEAWLVRSFVTRWVSRMWWGSWSLCGRTQSGLGASGFTHPAYQHHVFDKHTLYCWL